MAHKSALVGSARVSSYPDDAPASNLQSKKSAFPQLQNFSGYLDIRTCSNWKRKFFVLTNNFLLMASTPYSTNLEKVIPLEGSNVFTTTKTGCVSFEIRIRKKRNLFRAPNENECISWTTHIKRASRLRIDIKDINQFSALICPEYADRLGSLAYPQTDCFIVCYSIISRESIDSLRSRFIPEIKKHCPAVPFMMVALKKDFFHDKDLSALTQDGIKLVFDTAAMLGGWQNFRLLLADKTEDTLRRECSNEHCQLLPTASSKHEAVCQPCKRLAVLMSEHVLRMQYLPLMTRLWRNQQNDSDANWHKTHSVYGPHQMSQDFLHIKRQHIDLDFEQNKDTSWRRVREWVAKSPCRDSASCKRFDAHSVNANDEGTLLQEEYYKIHSYFMHAVMQIMDSPEIQMAYTLNSRGVTPSQFVSFPWKRFELQEDDVQSHTLAVIVPRSHSRECNGHFTVLDCRAVLFDGKPLHDSVPGSGAVNCRHLKLLLSFAHHHIPSMQDEQEGEHFNIFINDQQYIFSLFRDPMLDDSLLLMTYPFVAVYFRNRASAASWWSYNDSTRQFDAFDNDDSLTAELDAAYYAAYYSDTSALILYMPRLSLLKDNCIFMRFTKVDESDMNIDQIFAGTRTAISVFRM